MTWDGGYPSQTSLIIPRPKDICADAHHAGALADGGFQISRHAHGQGVELGQGVSQAIHQNF